MTQKPPSPEDLLAALAEADRAAASPLAWATLAGRLERPRLADRLPLGALAAWRQAGEFMRPAVAGTAVATLAGLALGTYLAVASQGGTSRALAAEPFAVSNLVEDGARGLAAAYFGDAESESDALGTGETAAAEQGSGAPAASERGAGASSLESDAKSTPLGAPAAGDSQGARP